MKAHAFPTLDLRTAIAVWQQLVDMQWRMAERMWSLAGVGLDRTRDVAVQASAEAAAVARRALAEAAEAAWAADQVRSTTEDAVHLATDATIDAASETAPQVGNGSAQAGGSGAEPAAAAMAELVRADFDMRGQRGGRGDVGPSGGHERPPQRGRTADARSGRSVRRVRG